MPQINILNILQGDAQSTIVDKLNYNFDQILSSGGGPQGTQGLLGPTGPIGPQGPHGVQGVQGSSGTKWFVQATSPESGGVTPTLGDYWLDPDSANQNIYEFTATGWVDTGYGLNDGELFQNVTPINIIGGATAQAILIKGTTSGDNGLVLSDSTINEYTPGGIAIDNLNFENSKLKIATRDDRTKLISFGRSTFDISPSGSPKSGSLYNPHFSWDLSVNPSGSTGVGSGFYNLSFTNPKGSIGIVSNGATAESGINMLSSSEITATSSSDNILLKTSSINKGTFIDASTNGGFLELSNNSSTPVNQAAAPIFANSTGVGLGLGTGQFKHVGFSVDNRRLAVNGNVSIGTGSAPHTSSLFVGQSGTPNYNKGVLFTEGHAMFGYTNPTGDNSGGISTTGMAEASNRFPQLFVTSPNYGPGVQVRTKGASTYAPRTIIGDGVFDFTSAGGVAALAGTGPDITQEFYSNGYTFTNGPLISYQHKISTPTNTTGFAPVFSVTTYTNAGTYGVNTVNKTSIQTKNSNRLLEIMANGTGGGNKINIGTTSSSLLSVWGASGAPTGGVSIGASASSFSPLTASLTGSTFNTGDINKPNHSLLVTGVQTIGTNNPLSEFNPTGINQNGSIGGNSKLKIFRHLYSTTTGNPKGAPSTPRTAAGFSVNNYPNGLEITSFIPSAPSTGTNANDSVAIAVGASHTILTSTSTDSPFTATGFFVSNTGQNIAVGQAIDYTAAIGVSGAGTDLAIRAKGNVEVTGKIGTSTGSFDKPAFYNIDSAGSGGATAGIYFSDASPGSGREVSIALNGYRSFTFFRNDPYATELVFYNANNVETGKNGSLINWGEYLSISGWTQGVEIPNGLLNVSGSVAWNGPVNYWKWFSGSNLNQNSLFTSDVWSPSRPRSITAAQDIHTLGLFVAGSDERIKDVIEIANGEESLDSIKKIEITKYRYKDKITKGNGSHTKVIAQQVKEILPEVISESPEFIPNIYEVFKVEKYESESFAIKIDKEKYDLNVSDKVKVVDTDNKSFEVSVDKIEDDLIYFNKLKGKEYSVGEEIFVYGKKVNDFLSVDYDNIMCLNVSATQHLSKIIDSQENKIKELEDKILKLEELVNRLIS